MSADAISLQSLDSAPVLALVPARGGSKGLSRKNLRQVGGRSLVERALRCGTEAEHVDHVFLSSEDPEILAVGERLAVCVLERPRAAASDDATADDVILHFAQVLPPEYREADPWIVYLQPTSPLRAAGHVEAALDRLVETGARGVISVVPAHPSPYKAFSLDPDGGLVPLFDETSVHANRQDLPVTYMQNGAIYIFRLSQVEEVGGFPAAGAVPYVMTAEDSLDVDSERDLEVVARLMRDR